VRAWIRVSTVCLPTVVEGEGAVSWLGEASRFGFMCGAIEGLEELGLVLGVWVEVGRLLVGFVGRAERQGSVLIIALFCSRACAIIWLMGDVVTDWRWLPRVGVGSTSWEL